ncbi:MAG: dihydropteroate synthase [Ferruginibacter sp.]
MFTINCKGKLLTTERPIVMGIINATPDSFYKGNLENGMEGMLQLATDMLQNGATILDIGGQSTKPGSSEISVATEIERVVPVIAMLHRNFPEAIISVDTFSSKVATAAVNAGASMVNDVSGGEIDNEMVPVVAALKVPYVCMHMKGTPQNMQDFANYEDVAKEVLNYFVAKLHQCRRAGIIDVIIDPGFGFAKNAAHNFNLLKNLSIFQILNCPLLAGLSRKSTIYKTLGITAAEALNGTTVLNILALNNGADILRVHDVKEAMEAILLFEHYKKA